MVKFKEMQRGGGLNYRHEPVLAIGHGILVFCSKAQQQPFRQAPDPP
jgi:hypothetical protein